MADAAAVLGAIAGSDPRDPEGGPRCEVLQRLHAVLDRNGLRGARIGVMRGGGVTGYSPELDAIYEDAIAAMARAGAILVDPADLPTFDQINSSPDEIIVLLYEFKRDLNSYLSTRVGVPIRTLADAIAFNEAHADRELKWFGQELFEAAEAESFSGITLDTTCRWGTRSACRWGSRSSGPRSASRA